MERTLLAALLTAATLFAAPAHAVLVKHTYTGSVASGTDFAGVFGPASTSLVNASFTATFIFDTGLGNTTTGPSAVGTGTFIQLAGGTSPSDPFLNTPTPLASATLSIGGSADVAFSGGFEDRTSIRSILSPVPSSYLSSVSDNIGSFLTLIVNSFDVMFAPDLTAEFAYDVLPGVVVGDAFRVRNPVTFSDNATGTLMPTRLVVSIVDPGETGGGTEAPIAVSAPGAGTLFGMAVLLALGLGRGRRPASSSA